MPFASKQCLFVTLKLYSRALRYTKTVLCFPQQSSRQHLALSYDVLGRRDCSFLCRMRLSQPTSQANVAFDIAPVAPDLL